MVISEQKLNHNLNFPGAENLCWYVGIYLGLPRVFMSVVRKKLIKCPLIESVLIPQHTVDDPITNRHISINITDRYFFIGSNNEIHNEEELGIQAHINTIMLLRNGEDLYRPSKVTVGAIKTVIREHLHKRKVTIQPDLTIKVTAGTFKDWFGIVESTSEDREKTRVRFTSDEYSFVTNIPTVLCHTTI